MQDHNALNIYTDGSSCLSPRRGGVGVRYVFPESRIGKDKIIDLELLGYKGASNNQMELMACITALEKTRDLEKIENINRIIIHTDSSYVVDNYKRAVFQWSKQGWKKESGEPVSNVSLWKRLIKEVDKVSIIVDIAWIKGHSKNENNNAVDKLAKQSAKKATRPSIEHVNTRRKTSNNKTVRGSVEMKGQKLRIRIITGEYLKEQRISKYRYEVMSNTSKYYQCVDIIYSKLPLRVGHELVVSFNKNNNFPQIRKVYRDITEEIKK